jgi:hypothetical protein
MLARVLAVGFLACALVSAQRGGGGGGRGGGGLVPSGGFGGSMSRLDRLTDTLKLNKDQKKDIKAALDDAQKEATPLHEQMNKSRLGIAEAVAAGKPKEEIEKAVMGEAELETQMTALELHAFAKALSFLEDDQKKAGGTMMIFSMVRGAFLGKNWNSDQ